MASPAHHSAPDPRPADRPRRARPAKGTHADHKARVARRRRSPRFFATHHGLILRKPTRWLRELERELPRLGWRSDRIHRVMQWARALCARARHWDGTVLLTRAQAAELVEVCERSITRYGTALRSLGRLLVLEPGSTPALRGADPEDGNHAQVLLLTAPAPAPIPSPGSGVVAPPPSGREVNLRTGVCNALRAVNGALRAVPDWLIHRVLKKNGLQEVAPEALQYMVRYAPSGEQWSYGTGRRTPAATFTWEMALWGSLLPRYGLEGLNRVVPGPDDPRHPAAALERKQLADQHRAERRAQEAQERAAAVPPPAELLAGRDARRAARQRQAEEKEAQRQAEHEDRHQRVAALAQAEYLASLS